MFQLPSIQTLICILHKCRKEKNLAYVHAYISNSKIEVHRVVGNYVVPVLVGCDSVFDAHRIFNSLVQRNVYSWTSLISGHVECGQPSYAFILYQKMQEDYIPPSSYTIMVLLRACARLKDIKMGRELHKEAVTKGFEKNIIVGNTLLDMYAKCGLLAEAEDVFMHLPVRDVVSWNVLLSGYVENELCQEALKYFEKMQSEGFLPDEITFVCSLRACGGAGSVKKGREMHSEIEKMGFEGEIYVGNTLVDMYAKCGSLAEALEVFDKLPIRTVVSWNALVAGYMENGLSREVLKCVEVMQLEGTSPDAFTYACSLKACSSIGAVNRARQLHGELRRNGLEGDPFLRSTLIDMYGKCGSLAEACKTFDKAPMRDVALWNAMINVYGTNHEGILAMQCFGDMQRCNIKPDSITFTCLLTACSRAGLVCQGQEYFRTMREHYGIDATIDHYTCMVDLLARSGYLFQAEQLLETILNVPSIKTWTALLSACKIYGEAKLALTCFQHLTPLNPTAASYVLLSSIYASAGRWEDASRIEELRKHMGAQKKPAMALIEVNKKVHGFVVGDIKCQSKEAISTLENLNLRMKKEGYIPILDLVLKPLSLEEKEEAMCGHAEKLAIAFGLLHTPQGQALYVTKNLRMCDDCHNAAKIISRIERRKSSSERLLGFIISRMVCVNAGICGDLLYQNDGDKQFTLVFPFCRKRAKSHQMGSCLTMGISIEFYRIGIKSSINVYSAKLLVCPNIQEYAENYSTIQNWVSLAQSGDSRWQRSPREERKCTLCETDAIEDEIHVFLNCSCYKEIRERHNIAHTDYYSLHQLNPQKLGNYLKELELHRNFLLKL